eukprot:1711008-Lingulodinium_polyedra.AAC.1
MISPPTATTRTRRRRAPPPSAMGYARVWEDCRRSACQECNAAASDMLRKARPDGGGERPQGHDQCSPVLREAVEQGR